MSKHTVHSSYREKLLEHLFVSELLKRSWCLDRCDLEVAKPEVDNAGYDIILEAHGHTRHVQLKASFHGSSTPKQKVNLRLAEKPSGCVVWIYFEEENLSDQPQGRIDEKAGEEIDDTGRLRLTMPPLRRCAPTACPNDRGTGVRISVG